MQATRSLAVATVILASLPLFAQQVKGGGSASAAGASANQSAGASVPSSAAAQADAKGSAINYAQMRPVSGELAGTLNSKSARVGETVVLKTTEKAQIAAGLEIPKGSQLQGHVTEVQAHEKKDEGSRIAIDFDRVLLKGGQTLPIHSMIESVSLPASVQGEERTRGWGLTGPGPGGPAFGGKREGGTATSGTAMAGHGLVGDAVLTADANGGQIHSSFDENVTGIPDVMLSGDPSGSTSGVLSAVKKNFRLDSGTQMVVGIVAAGK